jgi:hypothetical protein
MNKKLSRLTFFFFIFLFIVLTPLLTFYSLGYRYNFTNGQLEKNGAFYVKSYPRSAEIYVDDVKVKQKTPNQITNLKSGLHLLAVRKDSYVPWSKKLEILPGETTFAEDIVLFYENRDVKNLGLGSTKFLSNRAKNAYAYFDATHQLNITDTSEEKNFIIFSFDKTYELLDWSSDNQKILLRNLNNYYIFNINKKELQPLALQPTGKIIWDNNNSDLLWYLDKQKLFQYDITQIFNPLQESLAISQPLYDFALDNDYVIISYSTGEKNYVEQLVKNNLASVRLLDNTNLGPLKVLLADQQELIFSLGSQLYIKYLSRDVITMPITLAELHDNRILLTNGHEIVLYHYKEDWRELIDRSSQIITDLLWHPGGSYFIYESQTETYLAEIDSRDKRNTIKLLGNPWKKMYLFNKKGDRLFVLTPEENFYFILQ